MTLAARDKIEMEIDEAIDKASREALVVYRPSVWQLPVHECRSQEVIVYGGKQAGKSVCASIEFASRVLGIPIIGPDGPIPLKFPVSTQNDPRTYWIIGLDVTHIGKTIYRLLFSMGMKNSLRVIKDIETGEWRMFNPANLLDEKRRPASVLCEPVIPARFIEHWAWESEAKHEFRTVTLKNGATIYAFPSSGRSPGMGDAVDGIWINEDIIASDPKLFIEELQDRLYTRAGWFMWDAAPQAKNNEIAHLLDRAAECKDDPDPQVSAFQIIASKNPFVSKQAKEFALARMADEDEIARRDRGEIARTPYQMYDFSDRIHVIDRDDGQNIPEVRTEADVIHSLYFQHGELPREWTRYLAIDPSHTRTGILSGVITPSEWNGVQMQHRLIVEWELVLKRKDATEFAKAIFEKADGRRYEEFIIDFMGARKTNVFEGRTIAQAASEGFARVGLRSRLTGSDFVAGCSKPPLRQRYVRQMLNTIVGGLPLLMFLDRDINEICNEFRSYRKKVTKTMGGMETILDEPANPRVHDLMAALEYLVGRVWPLLEAGEAYHVYDESDQPRKLPPWLTAHLAEQRERPKQIHLGPGLSAA